MQLLKRIVPVVATIALLSSTAYAAIQKGYVRDQYGNGIAGAHVVNTRQSGSDAPSHVITDANGYYEVYAQDWSGSNTFVAYKDGYTTPYRWNDWWSSPGMGATSLDWSMSQLYNGYTVHDSFSGSGSAVGSTTDDAEHFAWTDNGAGVATLGSGMMTMPAQGISIGPNSFGMPFLPADFDMSVRMRFDGGGWAILAYRQDTSRVGYGDYSGGQALWFAQDGRIAGSINTYGPTKYYDLTQGDPQWQAWRDVRIRNEGYHQKIWIDGNLVVDDLVIDVPYDMGAPRGGYIGFFESAGTTMYFDSISITELTTVPEPSSIVTLLAGSAGLIGFARRRRS